MTCNADGTSKENTGMSSYSFCIRNSEGNLIYAKALNIGISTYMEAELLAILQVIKYCISREFLHVHLQTNSLGVKRMIIGERKVPWLLSERIEEIMELVITLDIHIIHMFRQDNQLVDFIANTTIEQEQMLQFHNFNQLPIKGRQNLNIDNMMIPYIRVRTKKISVTHNQ